jgi:hypothetical protein
MKPRFNELSVRFYKALTRSTETQKMEDMTIWRLLPHHKHTERAIAWTRANERIAIGWNRVGDVRGYSSEEEVKTASREGYPVPEFKNNAHLGAPSLWNLCHTMRTGDLVIIRHVLVVQVEGPYEFTGDGSQPEEEYAHQRLVSLTCLNPETLWTAAGEAPGKQIKQPLVQCAKPLNLDDVISLVRSDSRT